MREFQVYFMNLYVGWLVVNEQGQYIYLINEPFKSNTFLKRHNIFPVFRKEQKDFEEPNETIRAFVLAQDLSGYNKNISQNLRLKEVL